MKKHLYSFMLPISATIIIPCFLVLVFRNSSFLGLHRPLPVFQGIVGGVTGVLGLGLMAFTISLFMKKGKGTLAPWNPTQKLVVTGPYKYTRNPMISGVFFVLTAESIIFGSIALFLWAVFFLAGNTIYFILSEEPGLIKRFGRDYLVYRQNVPMWIPGFLVRKKKNSK